LGHVEKFVKASPVQTSFNAGELSPLLDGRTDLDKYAHALKRCENFIPTVQGPLKRRGGTRYIAPIKLDSISKAWLVPFEIGNGSSYVCEFGPLYIRFYVNHGQLSTGTPLAWNLSTAYVLADLASRSGVNYYCTAANTNQQPPNASFWYAQTGSIYEVPTGFLFADLTNSDGTCALQFAQSNDVLYIAHPRFFPQKLSRIGVGSFKIENIGANMEVPTPFKSVNITTTTVQASADVGGGVTLTASAAIFTAAMVGQNFYVEQPTNNPIKTWEPGKVIAANDRRRSGLNNYIAVNASTTGTVKPTHTVGMRYDGDAGIQWNWTDDGFGVCLITGFTSTTIVTVSIMKRFPWSVTTAAATPTTKWAYMAWTATDGFPRSVAFFRGRLCWGRDSTVWGSVPSDFENQNPLDGGQTTDSSALTLSLAADNNDFIKWMRATDALLVGTSTGEYAITEITSGDPFASDNAQAKRQSGYGSNGAQGLVVSEFTLFVQRGGRKVRELTFDIQSNGYTAKDLTVLSENMTTNGTSLTVGLVGVLQMAFQRDPDAILWCVRADGLLMAFTYNREQQVYGWHRQPLGGPGYVESVASIAAPNNAQDDVYMIVRRVVASTNRRYVEWLGHVEYPGGAQTSSHPAYTPPPSDYTEGTIRVWDAFHVDAGLSYDGAPASTFSGMGHLEGMTVDILHDGAVHRPLVVSSGAVTLDPNKTGKTVHIGLTCPCKMQTMRFNAGNPDGTAQGKLAKLIGVVIRFFETVGGKIGEDPDGNLVSLELRDASAPMDQANAPFTGDTYRTADSTWNDQGVRVAYVNDQPLPVTIVAVMPQLKTEGERA
jgi:hypothetical protein